MQFTIKLESANEGFLRDKLKKVQAFIGHKMKGTNNPSTPIQHFPSISTAFDYCLTHIDDKRRDKTHAEAITVMISYGDSELETILYRTALDEQYKSAVVTAFNSLRTNLPKIIEASRKSFMELPDMKYENPDMTPVSRQEVLKILPTATGIYVDSDSNQVTIDYGFRIDDFYQNMEEYVENYVGPCPMGAYKDGITKVGY